MVVSGRKLGLVAAIGLPVAALLLASCGSLPSNPGTAPTNNPPSVLTTGSSSTTSTDEGLTTSSTGGFPFTTSPTTLFPSEQAFMQELSGDGYQVAIVFTDQQEGTIFTMVWILVDRDKATRATNEAIFDQAVALARKYGAADSTGGRLRVELSDPPNGELIRNHIFESRDFDLSGSAERSTTTSTDVTTTSTTLASMTESAPADFGFVAAYGVMGRNVVDTFAGTFTKDLVSAGQATTELRLSDEEMQSLYRDLAEMQAKWQLFATPFSVDADYENTGTSLFVHPSATYRLEWQLGEFRSVPIIWDDNNLSFEPKAVALRGWFSKLRRMIEAKPEYQALPPAEGGYA